MARPLSEEKRNSILTAALEHVATDGVGARTAKIATSAGVAEGTIFTYFATKEALLNELYVALKHELGEAMQAEFGQSDDLVGRWQRVWDSYIDWGVRNSVKRKALKQLYVSDCITAESRRAALSVIDDMASVLLDGDDAAHRLRRSGDFIIAAFEALAEMSIDMIAKEPVSHLKYKRQGFDSFWRGVASS